MQLRSPTMARMRPARAAEIGGNVVSGARTVIESLEETVSRDGQEFGKLRTEHEGVEKVHRLRHPALIPSPDRLELFFAQSLIELAAGHRAVRERGAVGDPLPELAA